MRFNGTAWFLAAALCMPAACVQADVQSVSVGVNGVICTSCAFSLDKGLKQLDGIAGTQLVVKRPVHIDIAMKKGTWIDPAQLIEKINAAGFHARQEEILVTATGRLERQGDRLTLTLSDVGAAPQVFELVGAAARPDTAAPVTAFADAAASAGKTIQVTALWKTGAKGAGARQTLVLRAAATSVAVAP